MKNRGRTTKYLVTGIAVFLALLTAYLYFQKYFRYPWTRDGQVRANVIGIAARVNGPISRIAVADNQRVKKGDLLIEIDPSVYRLAVKKARAVPVPASHLPVRHRPLGDQGSYPGILRRRWG